MASRRLVPASVRDRLLKTPADIGSPERNQDCACARSDLLTQGIGEDQACVLHTQRLSTLERPRHLSVDPMLDVLGQELACRLRFGPRPSLPVCLPVRLVVHIGAHPVVFDVPQQTELPAHQGAGVYRGVRPGHQTPQDFAPCDLFADEHEHGVWPEDPKVLDELAMTELTAASDALSTRWKWAEAVLDVDRSATARYARVHPVPGEPTETEAAETERLRTHRDEIATVEEHELTDDWVERAETIDARLDAMGAEVEGRARFRTEDFAMTGCIAIIGRDGALRLIEGLVQPEDIAKANGRDAHTGDDGEAGTSRDDGRAIATPLGSPVGSPVDPRAKAREGAGVGIGLTGDLRAIRTALVKAHLAGDFEAAFDLVVFQTVRSAFARGYIASWHALDIAFNETADRPATRANDDDFATWSPGEATPADGSHLPFEWREGDAEAACFAALARLPRADNETLSAAAVARTVKGPLAFEHDARPELEATVARLDVDFATHVRPSAATLWSRIKTSRILDIARESFRRRLGVGAVEVREGRPREADGGGVRGRRAAGGPGRHRACRGARLDPAGLRRVRCGRYARRTIRRRTAGRRRAREHHGRIRGCKGRCRAPRRWSRASSRPPSPGAAPPPVRRPRPGAATANPRRVPAVSPPKPAAARTPTAVALRRKPSPRPARRRWPGATGRRKVRPTRPSPTPSTRRTRSRTPTAGPGSSCGGSVPSTAAMPGTMRSKSPGSCAGVH